ncbi:response regulator [Kriegella aquimaris]|uniref:Response regulator receiver domain-containing protein n=1 Tax=Kriegella aquimaris TaxID=192904 RepID=A0A1G9KMH7_9FLAO|nr:response regulator [Kriegella aquimaris]SDL50911.1 Response regulator receiver domain-containing protein [Kriegella aquimaris]
MSAIKIYLADDDGDDRELFIEALSEIPLETTVTEFDNGIDLMDDLFSNKPLPDVIFLDLRMPLMDGFECLSDIRSFNQFSQVKVNVYSSSYHEREVNQLKEDGANRYLQKPTSFNQLKTLLYKSIRHLEKDDNQGSAAQFVILT